METPLVDRIIKTERRKALEEFVRMSFDVWHEGRGFMLAGEQQFISFEAMEIMISTIVGDY